MSEFNTAINFEIEGLSAVLNDKQLEEFKNLRKVIRKLNLLKDDKIENRYYFNFLPKEFRLKFLLGKTFISNRGWKCTIEDYDAIPSKEDPKIHYGIVRVSSNGKTWNMKVDTLIEENKLGFPDKYRVWVTKANVNSILSRLYAKKEAYEKMYFDYVNTKNKTIASTINSYTNDAVVTQTQIHRAKVDIREDETKLKTAFDSSLSTEEKETLINWIKRKVFSLRLWVVKDGAYDKALTELFPDEQYGEKTRGPLSEGNVDRVGGYVSFIDLEDCPMELFSKISGKVNPEDNFKKAAKGNNYRFNNYAFVLYLLQEYNKDGFVSGKRNLYKSLH